MPAVVLEKHIMKLIEILETGQLKEQISSLPNQAFEVCSAYTHLYKTVGYQPPWLGYLAFIGNVCVGSCGFKSPPKNNRVEIAYFTFPEHERKGIATQMAKSLIEIVIKTDPRVTIAAQTLPQESPSTTILKNIGFNHVETLEHPEDGQVWEWHLAQHRHSADR